MGKHHYKNEYSHLKEKILISDLIRNDTLYRYHYNKEAKIELK